jgi:parallel beta-helix repeat protein
MEKSLVRNGLVFGIIVLFIGASIVSAFNINPANDSKPMNRGNWLYVGGSGPGNYTTIQSAIDAASPGDTVFVYSGTYYENVGVDKTINLIGENKNTTIIDASGGVNAIVIESCSNVLIENFSVKNAAGSHPNGNGIIILSSNNCDYNTISNCLVYDNDNDGVLIYPSKLKYADYNTIINCDIYNSGRIGIEITAYDGPFHADYNRILNSKIHNNYITGTLISTSIYCLYSTISDCEFYGNGASAIYASSGVYVDGFGSQILNSSFYNNNGNGIWVYNTDDATITNCTSYNNLNCGIYVNRSCNNHIFDNKIYGNQFGIYIIPYDISSDGNVVYHNNLLSNNLNAYDECTNIWDNDYPSGGNYYDDYTGQDNNGDGIGDTPYNISGGSNQDLYPLMFPCGSLEPIACWHFDEGSENIAHDSSGNNYNGTIQDGSWVDGISGYGLDFGGLYESGYVDFTSPVLNTPPYTVCLWAKPHSISNGYYYLISNGGETASYGFYMTLNIDEPSALSGWNFGVRSIDGKVGNINYSVTSTDWVFLCGTWGGSANVDSVKLYVNGVLSKTGTPWLEPGQPNPYNLRIGLPRHPNYYGFNGTLDEVRIYNHVLSDNEIQSLYDEYSNQPPNKPNRPSGQAHGKAGVLYTYTTNTTDPDGDQVYYKWDWGDGSFSDWLGPNNSGMQVSASHGWAKGSYDIKVKAKDIHGAESDWSDPLPVSMPRTISINSLLLKFFERFPHAFPILRHLMRLY